MSNDWDRYVRVIRADGTERTLPLAAWTEDLERRCLEAGCRIILPEEREAEPARRPGRLPPKPSQRDVDLAVLRDLLLTERGLSAWEVEFAESLARWMESHDTLTERQRTKAEQIIAKLEEQGS